MKRSDSDAGAAVESDADAQDAARHSLLRLREEALPIGQPIGVRVVDEKGHLLLSADAVLPDEAYRAALFSLFLLYREMPGETEVPLLTPNDTATAGPATDAGVTLPTLRDMRLEIGTRLAIRLPLGNGRRPYASRLIGVAPNDLLFAMPPIIGRDRLTLSAGEQVEVLAVGKRTVFLFASTVEAVCPRPFPYLVLSPPARIRRIRHRRSVRLSVRLPVFFAVRDKDRRGVAASLDLSAFGLLLDVDSDLGVVGDIADITFYIEIDGESRRIETGAQLRGRGVQDQGARQQYRFGLEFTDMKPDDARALRHYMAQRRMDDAAEFVD